MEVVNHILQFSGGAGSFAAAVHLQRMGYPLTLMFADTQMEDEDLYRYVRDCHRILRCPLVTLTDGRTPWEVFKYKRFIGNSRVDPCSRILKRELTKSYIKAHYDPEDTLIHFGIDWSEAHRLEKIRNFWEPFQVYAPLCHIPNFDKNEFLAWTEELWGIKSPRLYAMGFPHNNCGGFCVKAGKAHFLHLLDTMPERYAYHEQKEEEMRAHLGKPYTILKETRKKVERYISLRELRERAEEIRKTEEGQQDWGGCGCFMDTEE